jgi:hypothetical protein
MKKYSSIKTQDHNSREKIFQIKVNQLKSLKIKESEFLNHKGASESWLKRWLFLQSIMYLIKFLITSP